MKKFFLFFMSLSSVIFSQTLINSVNLPSGTFWTSGYGMVYENSKYWISSTSSTTGRGIIYAVDENGNLVDTLDINYPTLRESQGLAFDGTNFWYIERKTARCDLFKVDQNGNVLDSITSTQLFGGSWYFGGAAWDGTGLWISVYYPNANVALYKINTTTKQLVDTLNFLNFAPGQLQPQGIAVKGCLLYTSDAADERSSVDLGGRRIITKKTADERYSVSLLGQQMIHNTNKATKYYINRMMRYI